MNNCFNREIIICVISNIILEPYFLSSLKSSFKCEKLSVLFIPYGEHNEIKYKSQLSCADFIVVWFNFEEQYYTYLNQIKYSKMVVHQEIGEVFEQCIKLFEDITSCSNAHIVWFLFEDYFLKIHIVTGYQYDSFVDEVNTKLNYVFKEKDNVSSIDLKHLIANIGIANAYDSKNKYRWNAPYSKLLVKVAAEEINKQYLIEKGVTKKCLILDCDNVLWGGIISEDGVENIKLGGNGFGRSYQDFQQFLVSLYYHGVILAINSKNDLSDVLTMFRAHSEMILKEEHIACFQVNWKNKADNIRKISDLLNLGLNSMVFIDDSDFEIESIKQLLPEVTSIKYERDTTYSNLSCFNLKSDIDVDTIQQRNNTYKTNEQRVQLKDISKSYEDYCNALNTKINIHPTMPLEYARIAELTQRTNKFTNGIRYTVAEIKEHILFDSFTMYSVSVSDRFSNFGLVGVFEIYDETLTLFSLSCRVLGREIESEMVRFISKKHKIHNIVYKSTGKNDEIKKMLALTFPNAVMTECENV